MVGGFEDFVEVTEILEAAFLGNIDNFFLRSLKLHGGPFDSCAADDLARAGVEEATASAADVFVATTGDSDKLGDTADKVRPGLNCSYGLGEPNGHGCRRGVLPVAIVEEGKDPVQVGCRVCLVPMPSCEIIAHLAEPFPVVHAELIFSLFDWYVIKKTESFGKEMVSNFVPQRGGKGEIDQPHPVVLAPRGKAVLVIGANEGEIAGRHDSRLAIDQVAAGAALNPKEFVVVLGVLPWGGHVVVIVGFIGAGVGAGPIEG
mgnify:CR=1 FL=1